MSTVAITVVPSEAEADIICGVLRANGIKASRRGTVMTSSVWPTGATSPIEVIVDEIDVPKARKLLESHGP